MAKKFLLSISGASLVLVLTLRLRTSYILQPNPYYESLPQQRRRLKLKRNTGKLTRTIDDPRTVQPKAKDGVDDAPTSTSQSFVQPLSVCERVAPIRHNVDMKITKKYSRCPLLEEPPEETTLLILEGMTTFGRTGNNLIELFHSFQYGRDHDVVVAIKHGSWATHLIPRMWMAIQDGDIYSWRNFFEQTFCVKIFDDTDDLTQYKEIIQLETRDLFVYMGGEDLNQYVEYQGHIIRNLWRSYNKGIGVDMRQKPVGDMCSVLDAMFGSEKHSVVYSLIHSRSLEGDPGLRLLERIARKSGCDPVAALDMEPEYVKSILYPLGMLDHPILFITDHQRPEILEKLLADPEIGPNIHLIPDEASWIGGDVTAAVMANVFIGVPASSFSGFIAKSRVSLGYDANYLFRKKNKDGKWVSVCGEQCIFDKRVMNAMA